MGLLAQSLLRCEAAEQEIHAGRPTRCSSKMASFFFRGRPLKSLYFRLNMTIITYNIYRYIYLL